MELSKSGFIPFQCVAMKTCLLLLAHFVVHVFSKDYTNTCGERCCLNYFKDHYNGSCVECPPGTHGVNCTGTCPSQYYGRLCSSKCDCPLHLCDRKYGCINFETKRGHDISWKYMYIAFTLIGSITIVATVSLMMLAKRCTLLRKIFESNENQTEDSEEEQRYERRRSLQSAEEQTHDQADENNYTDLRRSTLSPSYDNPEESKPSLNPSADPADPAKCLAVWDLSNDEEDDNSDEQEGEDNGYWKHEVYNVLSLRRTYPDKTIYVRPVSGDEIEDNSLKETPDGYQSIQIATAIFPGRKLETSNKLARHLSKKETTRQSQICETIDEYIQTSTITKQLNELEDENIQKGMIMTNSKCQTQSTGFEQSLQNKTQTYSLAKLYLSSDSMQDNNPLAKSIHEDDVNDYDVVNKEDDVIEDDDTNEDHDLCEESSENTDINEGYESPDGNLILQESGRAVGWENQSEKASEYIEILSLSLTDSQEEITPNLEYTQVIKKANAVVNRK